MSVNRLFEVIEDTRQAANWRAAFGEPHQAEGVTLIPVAQVGYAYGLGFGHGVEPDQTRDEAAPPAGGEGGGGGGGGSTRPLGTLVISEGEVSFESTADEGKIALASLAVAALAIWELSRTLRALLDRR